MDLKLSKFAHVFPGRDAVALLNSLRFKPVFLSYGAYNTLRLRYSSLPANDEQIGVNEEFDGVELALHSASVLVDHELDEEHILERYRKQLTGHPGIHVCYLLLTDECNLRCTYCFIENSLPADYRHQAMTPDTSHHAVDCFHRAALRAQARHPQTQGEYTLLLYGGEPCLNIAALATALRRARALVFPGPLKIAMVTNGTRINAEIATLLKEHDVGVSVSLDGPKETTDCYRNRGTYDHAIEGLNLLRAAGIDPGGACTVPPGSLDNFQEVQDWLLRQGIRNVGFNLVTRPAGGYNSTEYYREATKLLLQAFLRFRDEGIFEDRIMRKVRAFAEAKPYPFDCAACGGAQMVVAPDGQIGICHALLGRRDTFVGSVKAPTFIPESHPVWHEWSRRSPLNMPECQDCRCLGICGGGCPVNGLNGIWGLDKGFCVHVQTVLEWLIWDVFHHEITAQASD